MLQRSPKHHIYTYIISWWNYSKAPFLGISLTWNLRPSRGIYNSPYIHHHLWFEALRSLVEVVVKYTQILSGLFMGLLLTLYLHVYHNYISSKKPININMYIKTIYHIYIMYINNNPRPFAKKTPAPSLRSPTDSPRLSDTQSRRLLRQDVAPSGPRWREMRPGKGARQLHPSGTAIFHGIL